jgi:hypothetical protein
MASFAHTEFKLDLRVAMIPVSASASERPVTVDKLGVATLLKALGLETTALRASGGSRLSAIAEAAFSYALGVTFHRHRHVWTTPADQGLFSVLYESRVRSCLRPSARE